MREWIERALHALGLVPVERERVLERQLQASLELATTYRTGWESAEARIIGLEQQLSETRRRNAHAAQQPRMSARARQLILNDKLAALSEVAGRLVQ